MYRAFCATIRHICMISSRKETLSYCNRNLQRKVCSLLIDFYYCQLIYIYTLFYHNIDGFVCNAVFMTKQNSSNGHVHLRRSLSVLLFISGSLVYPPLQIMLDLNVKHFKGSANSVSLGESQLVCFFLKNGTLKRLNRKSNLRR